MDDTQRYITFVRERITDLRTQKDVSEHRMSLELGKSGSYVRGITSGAALPSLRELFNIMAYFEVSPTHKARTWLLDPRAPKVEPPEHIRALREKGVNRRDG